MKKFIQYLIFSLIAVAVITGGTYGICYYLSTRINGKAEIPGLVNVTPSSPIPLGENIPYSLEFDLPLCRKVLRASTAVSGNLVSVGELEIRKQFSSWLFQRWTVSGLLRGIRPGETVPGVLAIELSPLPGALSDTLQSVTIASFEIGNRKALDSALKLAAETETPQNAWPLWRWIVLISGALLILAVVLLVYFRRKRRIPELPPWEKALLELDELSNDVKRRKIPVERGIFRLSDLVRNYLEKRFALKVSTRTTPEFMEDMDRSDSPLPEDQRPFLREFLNSADQIKFAKAPADDSAFLIAAERAGELIESTRITPDEADGKEVKHD